MLSHHTHRRAQANRVLGAQVTTGSWVSSTVVTGPRLGAIRGSRRGSEPPWGRSLQRLTRPVTVLQVVTVR